MQFIPAFSYLTEDAVREAETGEVDGVALKVVGPAHLAVIALSVGRAKDWARIVVLRDAGATSDEAISFLAERHGLGDAWRVFLERFGAS